MRLSRPCYDKMHRCPGWVGGGMLSAKVIRCQDGRINGAPKWDLYTRRLWRWRFSRCDRCGVVVLPCMVRYLDWRWVSYAVPRWFSERLYAWQRR